MEDIVKEERNAPFSEKMDFIRDIILKSVKKNIIKKVYLFGSYAYGEPDEDSDVDLCVVIDNKSDRPEVQLKIKCVLMDNKIIPSDLLVFNLDKFYGAKNPAGIERTIMKYGKLLYEK